MALKPIKTEFANFKANPDDGNTEDVVSNDVSRDTKYVKTEVDIEWTKSNEDVTESKQQIKCEQDDNVPQCSYSEDRHTAAQSFADSKDGWMTDSAADIDRNTTIEQSPAILTITNSKEATVQRWPIPIDNKISQINLKKNYCLTKEVNIVLKRIVFFKTNFVCNICYEVFENLEILKDHKDKTIHKKLKRFQCGLCPLKFAKPSDLKRHQMTHNGIKPYTCDICSHKSAKQDNLKRHYLTHSGEKRFICDICSQKCMTLDNLKQHKMIHSGEKPYECDLCEYKSIKSSSLKRHKLIHTGKKPHRCDICLIEFRSLSNLNYHKIIHTGVKQFKCDLCPLEFVLSSYLKQHKKIHSGDYRHLCSLCEYRATRPGHLRQHMILNHSQECVQMETLGNESKES